MLGFILFHQNYNPLYSDLISIFPWGSTHSEKDYYFRRGLIYFNVLKNYKLALNDFLESQKINDFSFLHNLYEYTADCWANLNYEEKAISDYSKELRYNPQNSFVYYKRGLINIKIGSYKQAYEDISKYQKLINSDDHTKLLDELKLKI